jgi:hypothetical protein
MSLSSTPRQNPVQPLLLLRLYSPCLQPLLYRWATDERGAITFFQVASADVTLLMGLVSDPPLLVLMGPASKLHCILYSWVLARNNMGRHPSLSLLYTLGKR